MADPLFLVDTSNHQGKTVEPPDAAAEGFSGGIYKATGGSWFVDRYFDWNLRLSRQLDRYVFAAYHYQRNEPAVAQVANIRNVVPLDVPVCLDVEAGAGSFAITLELARQLRAEGYRVPLLYLPEWYWIELGYPDLSPIGCPLWSSVWATSSDYAYASVIWNTYENFFLRNWDGYGGLPMAVMQFSASAIVSETYPVDVNAYRGSFAELRDLLYEEADMTPEQDEILREIRKELTGSSQVNQYPGWPSLVQGSDKTLTLLDFIRSIDRYTFTQLWADRDDVDESAIAQQVLQGLDAQTIAEAIPNDLASRVVDELHRRLQQ